MAVKPGAVCWYLLLLLLHVQHAAVHTPDRQPLLLTDSRSGWAQGLLCGCLQVVIQKLTEREQHKVAVVAQADAIMEALLSVFHYRAGTVHEEAMLAVGRAHLRVRPPLRALHGSALPRPGARADQLPGMHA